MEGTQSRIKGPCVLTRHLSHRLRPRPGADQPDTAWCWADLRVPACTLCGPRLWAHNEAVEMPSHAVPDCSCVLCASTAFFHPSPEGRNQRPPSLSVHLQRRGAKWAPILAQILPKLVSLFQSGLQRARPVCTGAARDKMTASL